MATMIKNLHYLYVYTVNLALLNKRQSLSHLMIPYLTIFQVPVSSSRVTSGVKGKVTFKILLDRFCQNLIANLADSFKSISATPLVFGKQNIEVYFLFKTKVNKYSTKCYKATSFC